MNTAERAASASGDPLFLPGEPTFGRSHKRKTPPNPVGALEPSQSAPSHLASGLKAAAPTPTPTPHL